jgi:hypothetical protein
MRLTSLSSIAIFRTTPPSMAGIVGAMFNCALQLGSAIGLAAATSIETSVEKTHGGFYEYHGRAAVFWFLLVIFVVQTVGVLVFYRNRSMTNASGSDDARDGGEKIAGFQYSGEVVEDMEVGPTLG